MSENDAKRAPGTGRWNPGLIACFLALALYLAISLIMFWPITANPLHTMVNGGFQNGGMFGGDVYDSLWALWWVNHAIFSLHSSPYFTNMLFYPYKANLVTDTLSPLAGMISLPLQAYGLPFAYNSIFMADFTLAGLFMFLLAYYIVRNGYAAFLAGVIFAFSPMHIAQAYVHLNWNSIEFIPLFLLFFILSVERHRLRYMLVAAAAFVFIAFFGDIEQGIMTIFFVLVLLVGAALFKDERFRISKRLLADLLIMAGLVLLVGSPFIVMVLNGVLSGNALSIAIPKGFGIELLASNNLVSFFLPSYYNGLFHGLSTFYFNGPFSPDLNERVSYIGYSVLFLAGLAAFGRRKSHAYKDIRLWLAFCLFFGLLSLGPLVQVYKYLTPIPGPYLLYHYIPFFKLILEPARFDLIVTMSLGILAAIGLLKFSKILEERYRSAALLPVLTVAFTLLILVEYNGMPTASMAHMFFMNVPVPPSYTQLASASGNYPVLILPDIPDNTTGYIYPGMNMYMQSIFQKPIFGGYISRETYEQVYSPNVFPITFQSEYLKYNVSNITSAYPIYENYTYAETQLAKMYNVSFVVVTRQAYSTEGYSSMISLVSQSFGAPMYSDNYTAIFSTANAVSQSRYLTPVAFVSGWWQKTNGTWEIDTGSMINIYSSGNASVNLQMRILQHTGTTYYCMNKKPVRSENIGASRYENVSLSVGGGVSSLGFSDNALCDNRYNDVWYINGSVTMS